MVIVPVVRYSRKKKIGDDKSPMIYLLKQKPGDAKIYSIDMLAREIESMGGMTAEDVTHVMKSFVRTMKKVLVAGNKVKVDGLGIFFTSLTCPGVEEVKECTVKNIKRVNLRFKVDNTLRLVNDSVATTRGGENNINFEIVDLAPTGGDGGGGEGEGEDPAA
ncbi:HU family DNA-binding protein [Bacteroides sp.]